jgi:hypothetical protein
MACVCAALSTANGYARAPYARAGAINPNWHIQVVDQSRAAEQGTGGLLYPSLAIDATNQLHIIYDDSSDGIDSKLTYAARPSGVWLTRTADLLAGEKPVLALTAGNQLRVAYFDLAGSGTLVFGQSADGVNWQRQTIASLDDATQPFADLALQTDGTARVVLAKRDALVGYQMALATQTGLTWTVAPAADGIGANPAIAVDALNRVHLSYRDTRNGRNALNYAVLSGTTWSTATVGAPNISDLAIPSSIAADANNQPHIAFSNVLRNELIYARLITSTWVTETVAQGAAELDVALDSAGNLHLAYIALPERTIVYALRENNVWFTSTVGSDLALNLSLRLDQANKPYIAYSDFDDGHLKIASFAQLVYLPILQK